MHREFENAPTENRGELLYACVGDRRATRPVLGLRPVSSGEHHLTFEVCLADALYIDDEKNRADDDRKRAHH